MKFLSAAATAVPVQKIIVKKRIRKNLGSLEELKTSISQVGLLNPIIINQKNELLSGERRLRATQQLGWKSIDALVVQTEDELSKLNIEIEENLHRKDFTYSELEAGIERRNRLKKRKEMPYLMYLLMRLVDFIKQIYRKLFIR